MPLIERETVMEAFTNEAIRGYIIANTWHANKLKIINYKNKPTKGHTESWWEF